MHIKSSTAAVAASLALRASAATTGPCSTPPSRFEIMFEEGGVTHYGTMSGGLFTTSTSPDTGSFSIQGINGLVYQDHNAALTPVAATVSPRTETSGNGAPISLGGSLSNILFDINPDCTVVITGTQTSPPDNIIEDCGSNGLYLFDTTSASNAASNCIKPDLIYITGGPPAPGPCTTPPSSFQLHFVENGITSFGSGVSSAVGNYLYLEPSTSQSTSAIFGVSGNMLYYNDGKTTYEAYYTTSAQGEAAIMLVPQDSPNTGLTLVTFTVNQDCSVQFSDSGSPADTIVGDCTTNGQSVYNILSSANAAACPNVQQIYINGYVVPGTSSTSSILPASSTSSVTLSTSLSLSSPLTSTSPSSGNTASSTSASLSSIVTITVSSISGSSAPSSFLSGSSSAPVSSESSSVSSGSSTSGSVVSGSSVTSSSASGLSPTSTGPSTSGSATLATGSSSLNPSGVSTSSTAGPTNSISAAAAAAQAAELFASISTAEPAGWTYDGCYLEPSALAGFTLSEASLSQTVEMCATQCNGTSYFALEQDNCYCANKLTSIGTEIATTSCNSVCPGNPNEFCGGVESTPEMPQKRQTGTVIVSLYSAATESQAQAALAAAIAAEKAAASTLAALISVPPQITGVPISNFGNYTAGQVFVSVVNIFYLDTCGCKEGLTTSSYCSSVTMTACGCKDQPTAPISFITTTSVCENCGPNGCPATVTLTVPCDATNTNPVVYATATAIPAGPYATKVPGGPGSPASGNQGSPGASAASAYLVSGTNPSSPLYTGAASMAGPSLMGAVLFAAAGVFVM